MEWFLTEDGLCLYCGFESKGNIFFFNIRSQQRDVFKQQFNDIGVPFYIISILNGSLDLYTTFLCSYQTTVELWGGVLFIYDINLNYMNFFRIRCTLCIYLKEQFLLVFLFKVAGLWKLQITSFNFPFFIRATLFKIS